MFERYTSGVLQGVISVEDPLDQLRTFSGIVTATDNWNGTTGNKQVSGVPVKDTCRIRYMP